MSGFCGGNYMRYKWNEVPDPGFPCCKRPEVKVIALHQIHCPSLPRMWIFKEIIDSFKKIMKVQDT